ncbi:cell wall / vacuolar inhibitor of fructosidase 2-like [Macadamia integrifolia]|uniref:cell wall / vacuolar inhibitor of fructosidase 2-like n=1 Tax=Macadamia integrifolia TaxID=60698 RepID=UPI001C528924|nr:cell wall / vacuolar inhibitor of fructosidase 2-like [Macadamia integrifolia]
MAATVARLFFLLPLAMSLTFFNLNTCEATRAPLDLIASTCKSSVFKSLCVHTLRSDAKSSNADLKGLAAITIENTLATATTTSNHITILLNATPTATADLFSHQCLSDCSQSYVNAINQLKGSLVALGNGNYNDASIALSVAMSAVELCEEGFSSDSSHVSVLKDTNTKFSQLCSNALAITNNLAGPGF